MVENTKGSEVNGLYIKWDKSDGYFKLYNKSDVVGQTSTYSEAVSFCEGWNSHKKCRNILEESFEGYPEGVNPQMLEGW